MRWILRIRQQTPLVSNWCCCRLSSQATGSTLSQKLIKRPPRDITYSYLSRLASTTTSGRRGSSPNRFQHTVPLPRAHVHRSEHVLIKPHMTVAQLGDQLGVSNDEIFQFLESIGENVTYNGKTVLEPDVIELLCLEYDVVGKPDESFDSLSVRPPVVTIMGHVDHGKTTLLDALRNSSIAAGEAGGITQHIGAFLVKLPSGDKITFIDTPGHAAFNSMRARGANATDIVVLVVAADDGVKTQTVESIRHAMHAKVPLIVAINKMDKGKKNLNLLKQQLLTHGIQLEEYGGDVQVVEISALKGTNLDSLTEAIVTLAELSDLTAEVDCGVEGVVVESKTAKGKGSVATLLVQKGTLKKGDVIIAGDAFAKVRQLYDDRGNVISEAPPSTPVEVIGWRDLPSAGEQIIQVESEQSAHEVISARKAFAQQQKSKMLLGSDVMANVFKEGEGRQSRVSIKGYDASNKLDVVIKGDVDGSVEAIVDALKTYTSEEIKLSILHSAVGAITESDVKMAQSFEGLVFGFNVKAPKDVQLLAHQQGVQIKTHRVIYKLLSDIKDELSNRLPPVQEDIILGEGEVQKVFKLTGSRKAVVAGCRVKTGTLSRSNSYRVMRGEECIFNGKLTSLKRGTDDVDSVKKEQECGVALEKFRGFKEGDRVECYKVEHNPGQIDWNWGF